MRKLIPFLALAVAVFAAYLPALQNGFVWDDTALILRDPLIRSWRLIPEGFQHFLFTDATASDFYRPLQRFFYTLEYWAFAVRPAGYHAVSLLCHALAAAGVFVFAGEFLKRTALADRTRQLIAFGAALAWAIHPLQSGAVAYVAGRADPLAAMFGFFGLVCALRSDTPARGKAWAYSVGAAVLFLCSALSKEMGLLFPLLWLVLLAVRRKPGVVLRWIGVSASVVVVYVSLRFPAEHIPAPAIHQPPPPLVVPIVASRAVAEYASLLVLPLHLYIERDVETRPDPTNPRSPATAAGRELQTLVGIVIAAAFAVWLWRSRKREPAVFSMLLAAVVSYLPVSGVIPLNASVAEHWLYVPSGFLFIAAAVAVTARLRSRRAIFAFSALASVWLLFLGVRTFIRTTDWKDQRTLFERTITAGGDTARMRINLAQVEANDGKLEAAKKHLDIALAKEPGQPIALVNLASVYIRLNDLKRARELLDAAITNPIVAPQAQELRVIVEHKETGTANMHRMRLAARTGPPNWSIEKRYIRLMAESGSMGAAVGELHNLLKTEWYRAESWQLLGELFQRAGLQNDAAAAFAKAKAYDVHLDLRPRVL